MAILDKLAFWKKKDDFADLDSGADLSKDPFATSGFGNQNDPFSQGGFPDNSFGGEQGGFNAPQGNLQSQYPSRYPQQQPSFQSQSQPSFNSPQFNSPSYGQPQFSAPSFSQSQPSGGSDYLNQKSLEVVSSKLDALRAAIDSMNARLANIERIAGQEEENQRRNRRYY